MAGFFSANALDESTSAAALSLRWGVLGSVAAAGVEGAAFGFLGVDGLRAAVVLSAEARSTGVRAAAVF
ncbi:hypothetical protein [Leifsonia sp. A12D58]|uniref:hypothetical protein n=1 Tax=Leifsonia sp. A12D58 TaxID=3397674 RepID=UPI0039E04F49